MTGHLLLITLGPVQDFITQARRTRDLWYGSRLLSELARAAARALVEGGACLVFPSMHRGHAELGPCPSPLRSDGSAPLSVANKLLAEIPAGIDPRTLARATREAVTRFWRQDIAGPVKAACGGLLADGIDGAWDEQIATFVEFTATWAPLDDYERARKAVEQALAARKNLRDFAPWQHQRSNVPKSSLDGARATVLRPPRQRDARLAAKYRIADGEHLDAVGLVKRAGGEPDQFVPIINVALASWVDFAVREAPAQLEALKNACCDRGLARVGRQDLACARAFPFDASVLLRSRWNAGSIEQGLPGDPKRWGRQHVDPLLDLLSEPYPYVTCLAADGDRMGRALDRVGSAEGHRTFSRALSDFAGDARRIVEQEHRGSLVYAGGDDVLAFLPLPEGLACADALRRRFAEVAASVCHALPAADAPTLSVGIGVGHVMESMGDLLRLGREAEKHAKRGREGDRDRNALAIIVDKRSGGRRSWRARWDEWDGDPVGRLRADATLLEERLSSRKVHELARTLRRLPDPGRSNEPSWARLLVLEVECSLARVHAGEASVDPAVIGLSLDEQAGYAALHAEVSAWIERMLVARTFAAAAPKRRRAEEIAA